MRVTAPLQTNSVRAEQSNPSLGGVLFQRKLTVGASNDPLEKEADEVAERVLATPQHSAIGSAGERIQRLSGQPTGQSDTAPASVDKVLASPGRPLEPALRQDMERRFGFDFSQVRVHSGAAAEQSARDLNATAYTVGPNIVFDVGRYAPKTREGRRLIAHELAHVVQQSNWPERTTGDRRNGKRGLSPNSSSAYTVGQSIVFGAGQYTPGTHDGRRLIAHELTHVVQQSGLEAVNVGRRNCKPLLPPNFPFLPKTYQGQRWITHELEHVVQQPSLQKYSPRKAYVQRQAITTPEEKQILARINKAIDGDPDKARYGLAMVPLRLPVEITAPGQRQDGGVYYDPYLNQPAVTTTIGRNPQDAITYIKLGPLFIFETRDPLRRENHYHTDSWIRSSLWHEFVHYRRHLAVRKPPGTKTTEEELLEAHGTESSSAEVEAYSIQLAKYFRSLSDYEIGTLLHELSVNLADSSTDQLFESSAIERIVLVVQSEPANKLRMLRCIKVEKSRWNKKTRKKATPDAEKAKLRLAIKGIEKLEMAIITGRYAKVLPTAPSVGLTPSRPDPGY